MAIPSEVRRVQAAIDNNNHKGWEGGMSERVIREYSRNDREW